MNITLTIVLCVSMLAAGCQPTPKQPDGPGPRIRTTHPGAARTDPVIATIRDRPITERQLVDPLIESRGLIMLMQLARLELAKLDASQKKIVVTREDIRQERTSELNRMFKDGHADQIEEMQKAQDAGNAGRAAEIRREIDQENEKFLEQWLQQKNMGRSEFELALEIRAYLVKIAEPELRDKLTEENVRTAWRAKYGENVVVQMIEASTMQKILEVQRRLATESFEKVAREMSENRSAALDGELPAFSREARYPDAMKDQAFGLKEGEVSIIIQTEDKYIILKVKKKIEPKAVTFESVRETLKTELFEAWVNGTVAEMQQLLSKKVLNDIQIEDPVLKRQFQQRLSQRSSEIRDSEEIQKELDKQRAALATRAATMPATMPAATTTTAPATTQSAP